MHGRASYAQAFFALPQAGARSGERSASHVCDAGRGNP